MGIILIQKLNLKWLSDMTRVLIAAISENGVIGNKGKIPWYIPEDLKHFKSLTIGHYLIIGKNTYVFLDGIKKRGKILPGREIIVVTKSPGFFSEGIEVCKSLDDAILLAEKAKKGDIFIGGGKLIYAEALRRELVDRMEITEVHGNYEGDIKFPEYDRSKWKEVFRANCFGREIDFSFVTYEKR
jgi:dihydrofolate reductase